MPAAHIDNETRSNGYSTSSQDTKQSFHATSVCRSWEYLYALVSCLICPENDAIPTPSPFRRGLYENILIQLLIACLQYDHPRLSVP